MADNLKQNADYQNLEGVKCPEHNEFGDFIPPTKVDKLRKKLIVTFKCPRGHNFTKEFDLK